MNDSSDRRGLMDPVFCAEWCRFHGGPPHAVHESGAGRGLTPETVVCSYTVTHGLTCCWHADERPSTWIVTLANEDGRCEHWVCDECAYGAAKGTLPEQHADQDFIAMRVRR